LLALGSCVVGVVVVLNEKPVDGKGAAAPPERVWGAKLGGSPNEKTAEASFCKGAMVVEGA